MKRNKNKKGFTIVELVIVIGVIGILSAILIPTFVSLNAKAEQAALESNLSNAYSMYVAVAADGKVDADEGGTNQAIELKSQTVVELKKGDDYYAYNGSKWVTSTFNPHKTTYVVAGNEALSTFGGFAVLF